MRISFYLFICILCFAFSTRAQSPRKVLVEHFTQASCPPCAYYNPLITPILERNRAKVAWISYQVSWPGVDPMNKDNPGEVQNRVNFYNVTGVPDSYLNAVSAGAPTNTISDASIQAAALIPSQFEIKLQNKILPDYNSMEITVEVKRTAALTGLAIMRVAVLEKVITWLTAPGTNGEKEFHHVMKKFLPNTTGTSLEDLDKIGESKTFSFIYKFDKLYDFRNLETVVFIQNDVTREVYQAENSELELQPSQGADIAIKIASATGKFEDSLVCGNSTKPIVKFINTGSSAVTNMTIAYSINGGIPKSYTWTGNVGYLKEATIQLPAIDFTAYKGENKCKIEITKVNGQDDVFPINNIIENSFYPTPSTTTFSTFEIKPAAQPSQISFKIYDDNNTIIQEGGPFTDNTSKSYFLQLQKDRCYRISVTNNTTSLNGTYKILDDQMAQVFKQVVIGTGTFSRDFGTFSLVSGTKDEASKQQAFSVYPNPANDAYTIAMDSDIATPVVIELLDASGKQLLQKTEQLHQGTNNFQMNTQNQKPGMYFISIRSNTNKSLLKFVIQ